MANLPQHRAQFWPNSGRISALGATLRQLLGNIYATAELAGIARGTFGNEWRATFRQLSCGCILSAMLRPVGGCHHETSTARWAKVGRQRPKLNRILANFCPCNNIKGRPAWPSPLRSVTTLWRAPPHLRRAPEWGKPTRGDTKHEMTKDRRRPETTIAISRSNPCLRKGLAWKGNQSRGIEALLRRWHPFFVGPSRSGNGARRNEQRLMRVKPAVSCSRIIIPMDVEATQGHADPDLTRVADPVLRHLMPKSECTHTCWFS